MLVKPPIEKLLPKTENRYTLAITVAKRARQLVDGANPLVDEDELDSPSLVSLAAEELSENQIVMLPGELEPTIPLRPEILQAQAQQREDEEEDGFEMLRQDLEAKGAEEEKEEEPAPRSMVRELREDELFELPNEIEREFFENFGDLDAQLDQDDELEDDDQPVRKPQSKPTPAAAADDDDEEETLFGDDIDDEIEEAEEDLDAIDSSIDDVKPDEEEEI